MYTKHRWESDRWHNFGYVVNLPENYDETKTYPLVFFLHGAGERGENLDSVATHGYMRYVREQGKQYPFLFVAPQCPDPQYWGCYTESLLAFIDYICDTYPVDRDRVILTGLSMGGTGTWMLAMADPDRFSCIVPICGTGIVWNAKHLAKLPIRIYHGDDDYIVPFEESVSMLRELTRAGAADVKLNICYGVGHNAWEVAYTDDSLIDWMLAQKRKD